MASIDVEDVADELISIFKANLASALQAVDARKSSKLNPDAPAEYIFGDTDSTPMLPSVIVTSNKTATTDDSNGWRSQMYHMIVEANYDASDVETCSRIIRRYGTAIDDTLRANNTATTWASIENIVQTFWDTMAKQDGGLFQAVRIEFDVLVFTD